MTSSAEAAAASAAMDLPVAADVTTDSHQLLLWRQFQDVEDDSLRQEETVDNGGGRKLSSGYIDT